MKKVAIAFGLAAGIALWSGAAPAAVGDAACARGDTAVLVRVDGFKARQGMLRVQVYGSNPADFLAKGKKLRRVDVPVARTGRMEVCVGLPGPGNYAVAVRHDLDNNGKSGWNDGGGFSRNPRISLVHLKPSYGDVVIQVGRGVKPVDVILNYRRGFSIGPVEG
ncbi:DUF2141 domain-containing protein [Sphingomonas sp. ID1715]|uniref:DUF2141 domain-containing protein n=1 Tax=Sphingomonas sp. ID1715 TaxID=1656898 RepID=UPI0014876D6B|nr:DUF2141 domain-containing protein [Sphingomonas sp. ID1715]NNM78307.1 DUF2141 domain-containing protein [Sphingomonas sp. ID1715]